MYILDHLPSNIVSPDNKWWHFNLNYCTEFEIDKFQGWTIKIFLSCNEQVSFYFWVVSFDIPRDVGYLIFQMPLLKFVGFIFGLLISQLFDQFFKTWKLNIAIRLIVLTYPRTKKFKYILANGRQGRWEEFRAPGQRAFTGPFPPDFYFYIRP